MQQDWQEVQVKNDETWDRQKELTGRYIEQKANVGPNNSMMYTIQTEEGHKVGVWGSTVLDGKFHEIRIGSIVRIVPKGEAKSKKGVKYQDFAVFVKPGSAPIQEEIADDYSQSGEQMADEDIPPEFR